MSEIVAAADDIGLAYPYSRTETMAMTLPDIDRLARRAREHLGLVYGRGLAP